MNKCILIVDDDPSILELLEIVFGDIGYDVLVTVDGRHALDQVARRRPDLILLDLMMPVMNGWDVMRHLRADDATAAIPVILVSADQHVGKKAEEMGAEGFCAKPFDVDEIVGVVEMALR